ncbi:MAG: hypothetical protein V1773_11740 [bacterium]
MNYINFYNQLKSFPAFTLTDINKLSGKVYYPQLFEWQKKGYIKRIANSLFVFEDTNLDEMKLFYLANRIYEPSYISLESALSYYGFIPEAVYNITSVSTKKTNIFNNQGIVFSYKTIKYNLNWGYNLVPWENTIIKMAEPEKALLDYFYLNAKIKTLDHIYGLRFNNYSINEKVNWEKLANYLSLFNNKSLSKRINLLKEWLKNA